MSSTHAERQRAKARALTLALQPLIEAHFSSEPAPAPPAKPVPGLPKAKLVRAAEAVARALDRLEAGKYTVAERPARIALERSARSLRAALQERRDDR